MSVIYAILPSRVKAVIVDQLIVIASMYGISELFGFFDEVPNSIRITAFLLIFLIYEPFFVSFFGGTIGHSFCNITVRTEKDLTKKIALPLAFLRFLVKMILGWLSLLTVTGNDKKKALHDIVVKSVVIES